MTLDEIYMPRPAGSRGRRIDRLGTWGMTAEDEARERRQAAWRRYAEDNKDKRRASVAAWRERQKVVA